MAQISTPFDPLEVGEIDNFAFDFTYALGASEIIGGGFTCSLAANQTIQDSNPQSHVNAVSIPLSVAIAVPPSGNLVYRAGNYVLASIGPMTSSLAGATYILEATAYTNDSPARILTLSSTVLILAPGS